MQANKERATESRIRQDYSALPVWKSANVIRSANRESKQASEIWHKPEVKTNTAAQTFISSIHRLDLNQCLALTFWDVFHGMTLTFNTS